MNLEEEIAHYLAGLREKSTASTELATDDHNGHTPESASDSPLKEETTNANTNVMIGK